jgi:hypothetical protein
MVRRYANFGEFNDTEKNTAAVGVRGNKMTAALVIFIFTIFKRLAACPYLVSGSFAAFRKGFSRVSGCV